MEKNQLRHIDLFSGIGGFALAADRVFQGGVQHAFCEIDPFCQAIIKKHYPHAKIYSDIRSVTSDTDLFGRVHGRTQKLPAKRAHKAQRQPLAGADSPVILTGGFPCQPFSQAGRRRGTEDDRYLWPEMLRIIRDWKPTWIIAENVRGLITWNEGMVLEQVCSDLEAEGYEVQPIVIPAVALNAPHRRDRVWFIAHRSSKRRQQISRSSSRNESSDEGWTAKNNHVATGDGEVSPANAEDNGNRGRDREERRTGERELVAEKQKGSTPWNQGQGCAGDDTDSTGARWPGDGIQRQGRHGQPDRNGKNKGKDTSKLCRSWDKDWPEVAAELCRVDDELSSWIHQAPPDSKQYRKRKADAEAIRKARLHALGNAIVPAVAEQVMRAIQEAEGMVL